MRTVQLTQAITGIGRKHELVDVDSAIADKLIEKNRAISVESDIDGTDEAAESDSEHSEDDSGTDGPAKPRSARTARTGSAASRSRKPTTE